MWNQQWSGKELKLECMNIRDIARNLRRNQTEAEAILWEKLRNRKLEGCKFLRQAPLFYFVYRKKRYLFIADFYCAEKKLVVELDGKIHEKTKEYDENREAVLIERGLRILRFKNEELNNTDNVLLTIKNNL
jgi:very-short-patch-repair endonuclease